MNVVLVKELNFMNVAHVGHVIAYIQTCNFLIIARRRIYAQFSYAVGSHLCGPIVAPLLQLDQSQTITLESMFINKKLIVFCQNYNSFILNITFSRFEICFKHSPKYNSTIVILSDSFKCQKMIFEQNDKIFVISCSCFRKNVNHQWRLENKKRNVNQYCVQTGKEIQINTLKSEYFAGKGIFFCLQFQFLLSLDNTYYPIQKTTA